MSEVTSQSKLLDEFIANNGNAIGNIFQMFHGDQIPAPLKPIVADASLSAQAGIEFDEATQITKTTMTIVADNLDCETLGNMLDQGGYNLIPEEYREGVKEIMDTLLEDGEFRYLNDKLEESLSADVQEKAPGLTMGLDVTCKL